MATIKTWSRLKSVIFLPKLYRYKNHGRRSLYIEPFENAERRMRVGTRSHLQINRSGKCCPVIRKRNHGFCRDLPVEGEDYNDLREHWKNSIECRSLIISLKLPRRWILVFDADLWGCSIWKLFRNRLERDTSWIFWLPHLLLSIRFFEWWFEDNNWFSCSASGGTFDCWNNEPMDEGFRFLPDRV